MGLKSLQARRKKLGVLFLLPSLLLIGLFIYYPFGDSFVMGFTNWAGIGSFKFVGLSNYVKLFQNRAYWNSMAVTVEFALISTLLQTVLGFLLAYFIYNLSKGLQNFFKVAMYLPVILPAAAVSVMWSFLYSPQFGMINQFLRAIGLGSLAMPWLGDVRTALACVIVTNTWRFIGFTMVLFYVAIIGVPRDVVEAADVDGAGQLKKMAYIIFPMIRGTTEINVILSLTGGMKAFDLFYLMTGGGPGTATQVVGMLIYNTAFMSFKYSKAISMSLVLFLIILALMILSRRLMRSEED